MSLIKNEISLKRYRRFRANKTAFFSLIMIFCLVFLSFTAEFWANSKPHVMSYHGKLYVPLFVDYHPSAFGIEDSYVMDYRALDFGAKDWAVWPLIQWDPFESNKVVESYPSRPSKDNWLGTDDRGRDVTTRLIYGLRYTFIFAIGCWVLGYLIGIFVGSVMGYFGGWVDLVGSRVIEVIQNVPVLILIITIISIFSPNVFVLILIYVTFDWTDIALQMRGQFLQLRKRDYVEAAQALGASHARVIFKHILPNGITPLVTFSPFTIAGNIYVLSTLDYLGLGLRPPTPSWGELMSQAQKYFTTAEWLVWSTLLVMVVTLSLFINVGLGVRDAFDERYTGS
jgi:microcin C transport system permease protein